MKVRYSLSWKEYRRHLSWRMGQISRRDRLVVVGIFAFIFLMYVLNLVVEEYREPYFVPFLLRFDATILFISLLLLPLNLPIAWLLEGSRRVVEIDQEGVILVRLMERVRQRWQSITVLGEEADTIYMAFKYRPFRLSRVGLCCILVPKRAFPSVGEAEKFYQQAQVYCQEAGGKPTASMWASGSLPTAQ